MEGGSSIASKGEVKIEKEVAGLRQGSQLWNWTLDRLEGKEEGRRRRKKKRK